MRPLIPEIHGRLERLIVVDPEHSGGRRKALSDQTSRFRRKVARASVAEGPIGLESVNVDGAYAACDPIQLRVVPGDRKCDRRVQKRAEVVGIMSVLPEV